MPENGHTSGVRVRGSDETNADQRERRRRMHSERWVRSKRYSSNRFRAWRTCEGQGGARRTHFVVGSSFSQRLRLTRFMLVCSRTTGLVSATSWLTSLLSRSAEQDAGARGERHWSCDQRDSRRYRNHDPAQHQSSVYHELDCESTKSVHPEVGTARCAVRTSEGAPYPGTAGFRLLFGEPLRGRGRQSNSRKRRL